MEFLAESLVKFLKNPDEFHFHFKTNEKNTIHNILNNVVDYRNPTLGIRTIQVYNGFELIKAGPLVIPASIPDKLSPWRLSKLGLPANYYKLRGLEHLEPPEPVYVKPAKIEHTAGDTLGWAHEEEVIEPISESDKLKVFDRLDDDLNYEFNKFGDPAYEDEPGSFTDSMEMSVGISKKTGEIKIIASGFGKSTSLVPKPVQALELLKMSLELGLEPAGMSAEQFTKEITDIVGRLCERGMNAEKNEYTARYQTILTIYEKASNLV
jgi:hypothetical protein